MRVNHEDKVKHREHIKFNEASFKALFQYRFEEEYFKIMKDEEGTNDVMVYFGKLKVNF